MKVLIAEDTEDSRVMLELALASQGHEVISGTNGIEALRLARTTLPDLIISDILMPEMDGFELCRQVKADPELKKIPFIGYRRKMVKCSVISRTTLPARRGGWRSSSRRSSFPLPVSSAPAKWIRSA